MIVTVDTGGTKTLVAAFGLEGELIASHTFPTPPTPTKWARTVKKTVESEWPSTDIDAVVIAMPGIVKDGVAVWCHNLGWSNVDVASLFDGAFAGARLFVENDANLAGLAEACALTPTPTSVLYVTISTGIGTAIITNGTIDPGLASSEGGHSLIEYDGRVREWESFASGRAIHEIYGRFARDITSRHTWQQIADRISRGFLALIPVIQPDIIIIGGSIGTYFNRYGDTLQTILAGHLPVHIPCPPIQAATHPEQAVIYGCYYYAHDRLANT